MINPELLKTLSYIALFIAFIVAVFYVQKREKMSEEKKKKVITGSILSLLAFIGMISSSAVLDSKQNLKIEKYIDSIEKTEDFNPVFEYGTKAKLSHPKELQAKTSNDLVVDTSKPGTFTKKIAFEHEKLGDITLAYAIEIKDHEGPKLTGVKNITINEDEKFSFDDLKIKASDPVEGELPIHYEGEVDTQKAGEYPIYAIAKDSRGNKTKEKFVVKVINKSDSEKEELLASNDNQTQDDKKETSSQTQTTSKPSPQPKPKPQSKPQSKPQTKPNPKPNPKPQPKPQPKPKPKPQPEAKPVAEYYNGLAKELFDLTNQARKKQGLHELAWNESLVASAKIRAEEVTRNRSHTRPDGSQWWTVNEEFAYGENFSYGQRSAQESLQAFLDSPVHRSNVLSEYHTSLGTSVVKYDGMYYFVQLFGQ